ncbi:hypothetical protein G7Z17_g783 [Cylindrodendrum hubeiense]|uniref:Uncharacterized protein n=1 Tax=Cylindrodendrum hubeiense TaxID=595255 RepID=A0A9P5LD18_9HYPO|nr:hypothetical protein G7Z17_g783 [Cylindrodendrum hubeiense]
MCGLELTFDNSATIVELGSEKKIDDIAKSIEDIKLLLQGFSTPSDVKRPETISPQHILASGLAKPLAKHQHIATADGEHLSWDHSAYIIGFVECVAEYRGVEEAPSGADPIIASLRNLTQTLARPDSIRDSTYTEAKTVRYQTKTSPMPPLEAVVVALRWVKGSLLAGNRFYGFG